MTPAYPLTPFSRELIFATVRLVTRGRLADEVIESEIASIVEHAHSNAVAEDSMFTTVIKDSSRHTHINPCDSLEEVVQTIAHFMFNDDGIKFDDVRVFQGPALDMSGFEMSCRDLTVELRLQQEERKRRQEALEALSLELKQREALERVERAELLRLKAKYEL